MKHLFVPYELALKLKEKGFNDPCCMYFNEGMLQLNISLFHSPFRLKDLSEGRVLAPLYQQVIDWFRDAYSIDIFTNAHYKTDNSIAGYLFDVYDRREKYGTHKGCFESPNYYEALNKAIEQALKII